MIVGVLGGGQLGRMLLLAGYPLGLEFRVYDPAPNPPGAALAPHHRAPFDDHEELARFASSVDVVTFETESIPAAALSFIAERVPVAPGPRALAQTQDRLLERTLFGRLAIPVARWRAASSLPALAEALRQVGLPAYVKVRTGGYDGRGQVLATDVTDARAIWLALGCRPVVVESRVGFDRELSIVAVRSRTGAIDFYPLIENEHRAGTLRISRAPALEVSTTAEIQARAYATWLLEDLDHVGVLTLEMFDHEGVLYANEVAPRVHNSGHWTIEGAATSQFENHLRAICGMPLGPTTMRGHAGMVNLLGALPPDGSWSDLKVHRYAKEPRAGRKLGHVTLVDDDRASLDHRLDEVRTEADALADRATSEQHEPHHPAMSSV